MKRFLSLLVVTASLVACSEHDCDLDSEEAKKAFGEVAGMTKGANHCFVSTGPLLAELSNEGPSLELGASHYDAKVDDVAKKYESFLKEKGWEVKVETHTGKRANGNPYEGKRVLAKKGDRQLGTIVYELTDGIVETTTVEVPKS